VFERGTEETGGLTGLLDTAAQQHLGG
jgi:hypothetical protein